MINLALIVLSQVAAPLVPSTGFADETTPAFEALEAPPPKPSAVWAVVTPLTSALGGAFFARRMAIELGPSPHTTPPVVQVSSMLIGGLVGSGIGMLAGYLAHRGSLVARIASVALYAMSMGAVVYEVLRFPGDAGAWICENVRFNLLGGPY